MQDNTNKSGKEGVWSSVPLTQKESEDIDYLRDNALPCRACGIKPWFEIETEVNWFSINCSSRKCPEHFHKEGENDKREWQESRISAQDCVAKWNAHNSLDKVD